MAELCLDRFARAAAKAQELAGLAGQDTVAQNFNAVALVLFDSARPALSGLAVSRPDTALRIRQALEGGAPGLTAIQEAVTGYLKAERRLGRVAETVDPDTVALAVVGTAHHLLMTSWPETPDPRPSMTRLGAALVEGWKPSGGSFAEPETDGSVGHGDWGCARRPPGVEAGGHTGAGRWAGDSRLRPQASPCSRSAHRR